MKKGITIAIIILTGLIFLSLLGVYTIPKLRVSLFVHVHHERIEESLRTSGGVPADNRLALGYKGVNTWEGSHPMTEFVIMSWGSNYYGCYYSPDAVPLPFQNAAVSLTPMGENCWIWRAEGDNRGETSEIIARWYFFKASF